MTHARWTIQCRVPAAWACALAAAAALGGTAQESAAQIPCRYEVTSIVQAPCQGSTYSPTIGRGISNHNPPWVAGYWTPCGTLGPDRAWYSTEPNEFQAIQFQGWQAAYAEDVTDLGNVVGSYAVPDGWRGFVLDAASGNYTTLTGGGPALHAVVRAANNVGQVVGNRAPPGGTASNAFIWSAKDGYFDLGVMNGPISEARDASDTGIIVGWTGTATHTLNSRAFIHADGLTTILEPIPSGFSSAAYAVNDIPEVVGRGIQPSQWGNVSRAFFRDAEGSMLNMGVLPGYRHSFALDISNSGNVVGYSRTSEDGLDLLAGFIWHDGQMANLNSLLPPGLTMQIAYAVNDAGQITGEAQTSVGVVGVVLTPVWPPIGDLDQDCTTSVVDLLILINEWGSTDSKADLNKDGIVNLPDLILLIENWTPI